MDLRVSKNALLNGIKIASLLSLLSISLISCPKQAENRLPYYHTPDFTALWLAKPPDTLHKIASFSFTDQTGKNISGDDLKGKIYVADFFFTSCPSICPTLTKHMKLLADSLKSNNDIRLLSFSVDPERDNVSRMHAYARKFDIDSSRWHLLTGNKADIYKLARQSYFAEKELGFNKDSTRFLHTEHFLLIDKGQHIRGIYNGTVELEMYRLVEDVRSLERE
jgi:protein SCO1/2